METLTLTETQWNTIVTALRTAGEEYGKYAKSSDLGAGLQVQFEKQAKGAETLEAHIREEVGL